MLLQSADLISWFDPAVTRAVCKFLELGVIDLSWPHTLVKVTSNILLEQPVVIVGPRVDLINIHGIQVNTRVFISEHREILRLEIVDFRASSMLSLTDENF